MAELEKVVTRMVFEGYGAGEYCHSHAESTTCVLRFLKYKKPGENEGDTFPPAHTDKTFLSILHQNNVRGLEVMTEDGEWVTFEPSPLSFMVMAGDACVVSRSSFFFYPARVGPRRATNHVPEI